MMLAVLVLVPLIITPGLLFYFDVTPKVVVLLIGTAAVVWKFRARPGVLSYLLALLALSLAISTAFSTRPGLSAFGTNWRQFGLITQIALLLFVAVAAGRLRVQPFLRATACAGLPIALYGIAQYFGWDPWIPARAYHVGEGIFTIVRPPGTLGYTSYFANYLVFVVFAGLGLWRSERGVWKALGVAALALGTVAIVLSGTRAAMLGLATGGALLLWRWRLRAGRRAAALATAAVVAALAFYWSPAGLPLRSRVRWFREDPLGGARLWLWRDSLRMAAEHWAFGWGPETFSVEFPRYQSKALARAYPDFYHESPHNIFLDALVSQGLLGLAALVAWIALGFHAAGRERGVLGAMLAASVVSHQFTVFIVPTALYFYLTVVLLAASEPPPSESGRGSWIAAPVSLALILFGLRLLVADRSLCLAKHYLETGHVTECTKEYEKGRRFGVRADLWYSRSLAKLDWPQALAAGLRATQTAEDPQNAWYNLASLYAARNDYRGTEQSLRAAIASSPNWFKPHWMLARVLLAEGRIPEAQAQATLAVDLDAGKNQEVTETWQQVRRIVPGK